MNIGTALPWIAAVIVMGSFVVSCREVTHDPAAAPFPNSKSHVPAPKVNSLSVLEVNTIDGDYGVADYDISIIHDDKRKVTCWIFHTSTSPGVWCAKDSDLEKQE